MSFTRHHCVCPNRVSYHMGQCGFETVQNSLSGIGQDSIDLKFAIRVFEAKWGLAPLCFLKINQILIPC